MSEAVGSLGSQLIARRFARSVVERARPTSMVRGRVWRPRWIRESRTLFRTLARPLGLISLTSPLSLSSGPVEERAPYYQGSLVLVGTSTPLEEAGTPGRAASKAVLPWTAAEVRRALERTTPSAAIPPGRPVEPSRPRATPSARSAPRPVQRTAARPGAGVSGPTERRARNLPGMPSTGPLPRPTIQEIGLSTPEGMPPVVLPGLEAKQEATPTADKGGPERGGRGGRPVQPGEAVPRPAEVQRQAERRAVAARPSPQKAPEERSTLQPVEREEAGMSAPARAPQVRRQAETAAQPPLGAERQAVSRPSPVEAPTELARRASVAREVPEEEAREIRPETQVPQAPASEVEEAIQPKPDLGLAAPTGVPLGQLAPEVQESRPVARSSPVEAAEPRGVQRVPRLAARHARPVAPEAPERGVSEGPVAPRAVTAKAWEPGPDLQLSYTALEPEYEELGLGVQPSGVVPEEQAPGVLPPLAARRDLAAEAATAEPEHPREPEARPTAPIPGPPVPSSGYRPRGRPRWCNR